MAIKFDAKKDVTNKLKFKPNPELGNLCLATIESVEVVMNEVKKINDKGQESTWEYAGYTIPSLVINFKQHHRKEDTDKADRFYSFRQNIIGSVRSNGDPIEDSVLVALYEAMWDRIKHIHDAFATCPNYKPFGSLPEINERGKVADRVSQFTTFFETVAEAFNSGKGDKLIYQAEDKPVVVWLKLLAEYNEGKYLTIPTFVGEGFIEKYNPSVPPTIEVKPNETVVLRGKGKSSTSSETSVADDLPAHLREMLK